MLNALQRALIKKFNKALSDFITKEKYLYFYNASERAMAHRLALYLQAYFPKHYVDCEYNLNLENKQTLRKEIILASREATLYNKRVRAIDEEGIAVSVFPDIIVHQRGENSHNKIIIEIKKNNSSVDSSYDKLKLKKYTSNCSFKYDLGIFLCIKIGNHSILEDFQIEYWSNGKPIQK